MGGSAAAVERSHHKVGEALKTAEDAKLEGSVRFFVAPKTLGDYPTMEFLWYLLFDHVHHRGQLSVYLRMVGKVPRPAISPGPRRLISPRGAAPRAGALRGGRTARFAATWPSPARKPRAR